MLFTDNKGQFRHNQRFEHISSDNKKGKGVATLFQLN